LWSGAGGGAEAARAGERAGACDGAAALGLEGEERVRDAAPADLAGDGVNDSSCDGGMTYGGMRRTEPFGVSCVEAEAFGAAAAGEQ
jgi:hypothetical protein